MEIEYKIKWNCIFKMVIIFIVYMGLYYLLQFIHNYWIAIIITVTSVLLVTALLYKHFQIITKEDIERYCLNNRLVISLYNLL